MGPSKLWVCVLQHPQHFLWSKPDAMCQLTTVALPGICKRGFFSRYNAPNISNCRWPSVSFPFVSSFGDCSHAYRSCDRPKTLWFEKKTLNNYCTGPQHFWSPCRPYCLTMGLTYDRADFRYKSLRNYVQKYYVFFSHGLHTYPTHLVCLCHLLTMMESSEFWRLCGWKILNWFYFLLILFSK